MTVRAWITISVAVLIALSVAVVVQFLRPVPAPPIIVHAGDDRLEHLQAESCWPQRTGELRCTSTTHEPRPQTIASNGSFRIVFGYPGEPKTGEIKVEDADGDDVLASGWKRTLRYDLPSGDYKLTATAGERDEAFVSYVFLLTIT